MAVAFVSMSTPVGLASGPSLVLPVPSGLVVGNTLVVSIMTSNTFPSPPSGWTQRYGDPSASRQHIFTHTVDGTESWFPGGGTVSFTGSSNATKTGFMCQYSGVDAAAPIGEVSALRGGFSTATTPVSLTGSVAAGALVAFTHLDLNGTARTISGTDPAGYTLQFSGSAVGHPFTKALASPETPSGVFTNFTESVAWGVALYPLLPATSTNATVNAVAATATATAPTPTVTGKRNATIAAVVATAAAAALAPVPHGSANVQPPAAVATATAPTPSVLGVRNVTIHPPDAAASVGALSPIISAVGSATVTVPGLAAATAQTNNPTVTATRNATVQAVTATATAAGLAPTASGGARVTAPTATATAGTLSPVILGQQNGTVLAVAATATADTPAPVVEVRVPSEPPPAERIYVIDASNRTVTIAHSNRTVTIPASNRTIGVRP